MAIGTVTALLIGSIISALAAGGASVAGYMINDKNVRDINAANLANQQAINEQNIEYSREFAQNQIQWKAQDLQAAGLNPVLAAQGAFGGSSYPTAMSSTQQQAPKADFSGISTALNAMNNVMLTMALMNNRSQIASNHDATLQANNQARNDVLDRLYQRKAGSFAKDSGYVHSAKQVQQARKIAEDNGDWEAIMKALKSMPSKYNWKR